MKTAKQVLTEALNAYEKQVICNPYRMGVGWYPGGQYDPARRALRPTLYRCLECGAEAGKEGNIPHTPECLMGQDLVDFARARKWLEEADHADQTA